MLFIGDSRVVGLRDYARSGNAEYFCDVGMTFFKVNSGHRCADKNFSSQTLESLLSSRTYKKIYIAFGINEAGYYMSSFTSAFDKMLSMIRRLQPDAIIILQSIMPVTEKYASPPFDCFKPDALAEKSAVFASYADGKQVFYVDLSPYFGDSKGYLYTNITGDGCHPTGKYYRAWSNWIAFIMGKAGLDLETKLADAPVVDPEPPVDVTEPVGDATETPIDSTETPTDTTETSTDTTETPTEGATQPPEDHSTGETTEG
jgi:hypothetical protein